MIALPACQSAGRPSVGESGTSPPENGAGRGEAPALLGYRRCLPSSGLGADLSSPVRPCYLSTGTEFRSVQSCINTWRRSLQPQETKVMACMCSCLLVVFVQSKLMSNADRNGAADVLELPRGRIGEGHQQRTRTDRYSGHRDRMLTVGHGRGLSGC